MAPIIQEIARPTQFPSALRTTSVAASASPLHREEGSQPHRRPQAYGKDERRFRHA